LQSPVKKLEVNAMQEKNWDATCPLCRDVIDNPICPDCLGKEIEQWLSGKDPIYLDNIRKSIAHFESKEINGPKCIKCGKQVEICPYCFIGDINNIIREKHPELLGEFQTFFGFEPSLVIEV